MEKVGQGSVSDISERNKGRVDFSYIMSEMEFWARYQKLSVGRFFRTDNARQSLFLKYIIVSLETKIIIQQCNLIIQKLSVHAKCLCTFQNSTCKFLQR